MKLLIATTRKGIEIEIPDEQIKSILKEVWQPYYIGSEVPITGIQDDKEILTVKEAAKLLNMKENTLYLWAAQRRIPSVKVGRLRKFIKKDLLEWFDKHKKDVI